MKALTCFFFGFAIWSCTQTNKPNTSIFLHHDWEFRADNENKWYPATVPGEVHLDLLANELIERPYYENNEQKYQWVGESDWIYRTSFHVSQSQLQNRHIEMEFKGLDTYARIKINGHQLLSTNNMFRSWQIDVKDHLVFGINTIEVLFRSPLSVNDSIVSAYPYQLPSGCETVDLKVGAFTRKAAYHFGWDWGPRFLTAGIWRPLQLNFWNQARLKNVNCQTISISDSTAQVLVEVEIESDDQTNERYEIVLNGTEHSVSFTKGLNYFVDTLVVKNPKLWWTNDMGSPHLYPLKTALLYQRNVIDSSSQKFGVRTIELINEPDSIGTSFYFKLNGTPVFMKGANYIPQDLFLPRVTPHQYQQLIQQVKSANMNMLRVWGGGIYENDIFYDLCDENGILVWQDFMFAGSLYPNHPEFMETTKLEIEEAIKRLRAHPCLAIWCGNNEIEVAWQNWGWQEQFNYSQKDSIQIWQDYQAMFHQMIPEALKSYHPQGNYTTSSPLSNWGTSGNFNHSSMHYWGVWHGKEGFDAFDHNVGRFMVEYGFQSFPSFETLKNFVDDSSLYLASSVMKNRQKSYVGNAMISNQINQYFDAPQGFDEFILLSQKTQALALKKAITAHLNKQPHCMGSLFWQLNDCWPGPSWSIIEYGGAEKLAYNAIKDLFE